jgi:hypothetical protein
LHHQEQRRHPHRQPVGDLLQHGAVHAVGHRRVELDAAVDRARVHHQHVRLRVGETALGDGEERGVLADAGERLAGQPLELHAQRVDHVHARDHVVEPVRQLAAHVGKPARQQRRRADEDHLGAELEQAVHVGAGDAAVRDVADDRDRQAGQVEVLVAAKASRDGEDVEQPLRGVLVLPVAGVDHAAGNRLGELVRRAAEVVPHDDHVDAHRLDVAGGVAERLALVDAGDLGGEVQHVGREPARGEVEAHARARRVFEEEIHDHPAAERGHLLDAAGADLFEAPRGVEQEADVLGRECLEPQQVPVTPAILAAQLTHACVPPACRGSRCRHARRSD